MNYKNLKIVFYEQEKFFKIYNSGQNKIKIYLYIQFFNESELFLFSTKNLYFKFLSVEFLIYLH